jgi:aconitate hydratase
MAPEYGATMGFFGLTKKRSTIPRYRARRSANRNDSQLLHGAGMFGIPQEGEVDYSTVLNLDLATITPSVSGPKRPQDRIELSNLDDRFKELFTHSVSDGGYGKKSEELEKRFRVTMGAPTKAVAAGGGGQDPKSIPHQVISTWVSEKNTNVSTEIEMMNNRPTPDRVPDLSEETPTQTTDIGHGDVMIAAITSCTNTSNPAVMLARNSC